MHLKKLFSLLCFAQAFLHTNTAFANTDTECKLLHTPYTATYYGSFKGWRLDATERLKKQENDKWLFSLTADNSIGTVSQKSLYHVLTGSQIESLAYHYQRKILFKNQEEHVHFDWKKKEVAYTKKDKSRVQKLQGGELDELSYQLAIRCDLRAGKKVFQYNITKRKKIQALKFNVIGEETLQTEIGELETIVVKRIREKQNRITTFWFAKDLDFLMVKLLQEERKDTEAYLLYIDSYDK